MNDAGWRGLLAAPGGSPTRRLVLTAVLGAIGFVLMYISFPIGFAPFLKYDAGDLTALVAMLVLGPWAAIAAEAIKDALDFLLHGGPLIGEAANMVAGVTFVVVTTVLLRVGGKRWLIPAIAAGVLATTVVLTVTNVYIFYPLYGIPQATAAGLVWPQIVPFNLIKFGITGTLAYVLVGRLAVALGVPLRAGLGRSASATGARGKRWSGADL